MRLNLVLAVALVLTGCNVAVQAPAPGNAAATQQAATTTASATLPFKTVAVDPEGSGRFFKAGGSETVVLHSKAELAAFVARHPQAVPPPAAVPQPTASFGPPSGIPFGTQPPAFMPDPLPDTLTKLDFDKYVAIAFFDGAVKVASASRIVAVQEQGDKLVASTRRWEQPAGPAAIPDTNGRLHVIALALTTKPVTFQPTDVVDGTSPPGGGGYSIGGSPMMRPRWPAVPNPDITQAMITEMARGFANASPDSKIDVQFAPASTATLAAPIGQPDSTTFTPDSKVWIVRITGSVSAPGPGAALPGQIGGSGPTYGQSIMIISPEDGRIIEATSIPNAPPKAGTQFRLKPDGVLHLGDTLGFDVSGPLVEGSLTMTVRAGGATPVVNQIAIKDLAAFGLKLDVAHVPFLTDAAVQSLTVELKYDQTTETHDLQVVRDVGAKASPPQRIQGPGTAAEYKPQPGESAADAFVRAIATEDWQGTGLTITSHMATLADVHAKGREGIDLAPTTPVRVYEVRGTFPTFLVPAVTSTTDKDETMAPEHLEIAVREELPVRVVSLKAFPR
ncbi:MAG: hypothetical protein JWM80_6365 [Cyanobacteria bacterium RYN_339]|nr:hypothetical protein [Cyanobacteria bacterium RYN_339]